MSETSTASPYLTTKEVAIFIRRTPEAVRQMRHRGTGPKGVRIGRVVLYHHDELKRWLAAKESADSLALRAA
ncbi:helix-turn-helix domain-containing protein [Streptomyces carpaticus]|uniref:helix-turn-helix transcriptional regulator n=1 Tax=Streptomyces carpaticus TaxID=285558 RepID=UPI0031F78441